MQTSFWSAQKDFVKSNTKTLNTVLNMKKFRAKHYNLND